MRNDLIEFIKNIAISEDGTSFILEDPRIAKKLIIHRSSVNIHLNEIKKILYKYYNYTYASNNEGELWFPEIEQQHIQRDAFWNKETTENDGTVVARKNSERARIPSKSYYEVGKINLNIQNNDLGKFTRLGVLNAIHVITSRDIRTSDDVGGKVFFFQVYGRSILKDEFTNDTIRFYFHLLPIKKYIRWWKYEIIKSLNDKKIPFNLKYISNLANYDRCDSGILYVQKNNFSQVLVIIKRIYSILKSKKAIGSQIPRFTYKLEEGLSFAESPNMRNESYGSYICSLIAEGFCKAVLSDLSCVNYEQWADAIINSEFKGDFFAPYLNSEDSYIYDFIPDYKVAEPFDFKFKNRNRYLNAAVFFVNILKEKQIPVGGGKVNWVTYTKPIDNSINTLSFRILEETERRWIEYVINQIEAYPTKITEPTIGENNEKGNWKDSAINKKEVTKKDLNLIIKRYIDTGLPIPNGYENWEFCPTITHGIARIAYLFLYQHNLDKGDLIHLSSINEFH